MSEVNVIIQVAAKKSTRNAINGLEFRRFNRFLLETDEIIFTAKKQEKVISPHHHPLFISLTVANFLVKRILVDIGSSTNIVFLTVSNDLGSEEDSLTRNITPIVVSSGEVKHTTGEVSLPVYAEGINTTKFLVVDWKSSYNMIHGRPWIHDIGTVPSTLF